MTTEPRVALAGSGAGADGFPPPGDPVIFKSGTMVWLGAGASKPTEQWVKQLAVDSGQPVDWHYFGGRVVVLALGDIEAVRRALRASGREPYSEFR